MDRRRYLVLALGLLAGCAIAFAPQSAMAQAQATSSFNVSLVVPTACTVAAQAISFPYQASGTPEATGTVTVNCAASVTYKIGLDSGLRPSVFDPIAPTPGTRTLAHPSGALIGYLLFTDAGRTQGWGDNDLTATSTLHGPSVAGTGTGSDQVLTIYGRLATSPVGMLAGTYTDTVTVVVEF